jgi:hypothetical protein
MRFGGLLIRPRRAVVPSFAHFGAYFAHLLSVGQGLACGSKAEMHV